MELEGFKRAHAVLSDHSVAVKSVTTDRHRGVGVYMREEWKDAKHFYDTWHISKGNTRYLLCSDSNFPSPGIIQLNPYNELDSSHCQEQHNFPVIM
jgi:hypothetical protein